jgi:hypothetical protein
MDTEEEYFAQSDDQTSFNEILSENTHEIIVNLSLEIREYLQENALPIAEYLKLEDIISFLKL